MTRIRDVAPMVEGGDGLQHLTFRQLLASKSLARRGMRRGARKAESHALYWRIEAELESRKKLRWSNIKADMPEIAALDEQANDDSPYLRPAGAMKPFGQL